MLVQRWLPLAPGVGSREEEMGLPLKCCLVLPAPPVSTPDEWQGLVLKMQEDQEESGDALDSGAGRGSRDRRLHNSIHTFFVEPDN